MRERERGGGGGREREFNDSWRRLKFNRNVGLKERRQIALSTKGTGKHSREEGTVSRGQKEGGGKEGMEEGGNERERREKPCF
jgi:hypothetical protein